MQKLDQPTRPLFQETALLPASSSQTARDGVGMKWKDANCTRRANSLATSLARPALLAPAFRCGKYKEPGNVGFVGFYLLDNFLFNLHVIFQ